MQIAPMTIGAHGASTRVDGGSLAAMTRQAGDRPFHVSNMIGQQPPFPMRAFDVNDVMARLPSLIELAARGDAFEITENGVPLVRVVPSPADAPHDRLGFFAGEILVPDDFDTMDRDRIEAWFGMSD